MTKTQAISKAINKELRSQMLTQKWLLFNLDMHRNTFGKRMRGTLQWKPEEISSIANLLQSDEIRKLGEDLFYC